MGQSFIPEAQGMFPGPRRRPEVGRRPGAWHTQSPSLALGGGCPAAHFPEGSGSPPDNCACCSPKGLGAPTLGADGGHTSQ